MLKMCGDRVLLEPLPPKEMTAGGIVIPEMAKGQEKDLARIVEAGPECKFARNCIGEVAMVPHYAGADIVFEEKKYKVFREAEIIALVEKPEQRTLAKVVDAGPVEVVT